MSPRPHRLVTPLAKAAAFVGILSMLALSALPAAGASTPAKSHAGAKATGPVTVTNCGHKITFATPPTRIVTSTVGTLDLIALGLTSKIVGASVSGDVPKGQPPVPPEYLTAFDQIPHIDSSEYTLETLVGLHPNFYFSGWGYGLTEGTTLTPGNLAKYHIKTLALTESCVHVQPNEHQFSINATYRDLSNLGKIFGVEKQATKLIKKMKAQIATVHTKIAGRPSVSVFDYDSGTSAPLTSGALATPNALIQLAGGKNIFAGLKKGWTTVSWEQVVTDRPQCIIINNYGTPTAQQKEKFLRTSRITRNLPAVRNHCILSVPYDDITPSPLDSKSIVRIAHLLHPKTFGAHLPRT